MERICPECRARTHEFSCPVDGVATENFSASGQEASDPFLGQEFEGRYKIEARLGAGGMGAVYLGTQLAVERRVAIKILHASFARRKKELLRFRQEARAVAALNHPNTIRLFDVGETKEDVPYIVMEFLEGKDLAECLAQDGPMPADRVIALSLQILSALSEAHGKGIVHRDLKPANLFLTHVTGEGETVKVLDFGIAKVRGDLASDMTLTQKGTTIGSPRYMAPEQARALEIIPATDIYAMGCILYEMLTGRPVYIRQTASDYIIAHVKEDPPWPCVGERRLEGPLVEFVMKCLEKRPADRPQDAIVALEILRKIAHEPLTEPSSNRMTSRRRRKRSSIGLFKPAVLPVARTKRLSGPLSTSQIGMVDDPTAQLPRSKDGVWWTLASVGLVITLIGAFILISSPHDQARDESGSIAMDGDPSIQPHGVQAASTQPSMGVETSQRPSTIPRSHVESSKMVSVTIDSEPEGALVWRGSTNLGTTPLEVSIPSADDRVHVRLTLAGYRTSRASFVPNEALSMKVPLSRRDVELVETLDL